jgi:murein DD-endopeptidase MepM/ murein hydrolase activator NlpD
MADNTETLLARLDAIDHEEDDILDVLVAQGAALEDERRRAKMVSVGDLRVVMTALEETVTRLRSEVAQAEAAAAPVADATPPPAPPATALAALTFEELAQQIREQDARSDRLKAVLRERLRALRPPAPAPGPSAPVAGMPVGETNGSHASVPVPAPAGPRTFRLDRTPMRGSDVRTFQHDLNRRFRAAASKRRVKEDGVYGMSTRLAARQVLGRMGFDREELRHGITPGMQRLVHKAIRPTPQRPPGTRPKPKPQGGAARPAPAPPGSVQAAIRKHGGRYEDIIVREAKANKLPVSLVCAVLDKESDFQNIYGRDNGRNPNPIRSPRGAGLVCTEANYKEYLRHRKSGKDANGVGPMQLTSPSFQERADKLGGCWKVGPNIAIGCAVLREKIDAAGSLRKGVRNYNGSGPAAEAYATDLLKIQATWRQILEGKHVAPPASKRPGSTQSPLPKQPPGQSRTFKAKGSMRGVDVKLWQITLRKQFDTWQVDYPLAADGNYGPVTRSATRDVLKGLGIAQDAIRDGVTPQLRRKVRNKHLTPREKARYAARAAWRRKLRKKFAGKGVAPPINKILTSANGWAGKGHDGVDLICNPNVPIMAICDAEVIDVRGGGWWGKSPSGDVTKGDGIIQLRCLSDVGPFKKGMHFGYGHAEHATVKKGDTVKAGDIIGKAGYAVAWHIHLMVNGGGTSKGVGDRDPMPFVNYAMKHGRR